MIALYLCIANATLGGTRDFAERRNGRNTFAGSMGTLRPCHSNAIVSSPQHHTSSESAANPTSAAATTRRQFSGVDRHTAHVAFANSPCCPLVSPPPIRTKCTTRRNNVGSNKNRRKKASAVPTHMTDVAVDHATTKSLCRAVAHQDGT